MEATVGRAEGTLERAEGREAEGREADCAKRAYSRREMLPEREAEGMVDPNAALATWTCRGKTQAERVKQRPTMQNESSKKPNASNTSERKVTPPKQKYLRVSHVIRLNQSFDTEFVMQLPLALLPTSR